MLLGIDPSKSNIFVQSHVSAHTELTWLLNCITPMNWLERMIQFKEKSKKQGESVGVGLFTYPCLMAADIMLYQSTKVPVGEDQRQHLELTRDIVRRFNDMFCKGNAYKKRCKEVGIPSRPVFVEPDAIIMKDGARVMSLTDGTSKMSKSDPNDASRINVLDPPDKIRDKIKRCKTDSFEGIEWDNPDRPEATNLLNIYLAVQPGRTKDDILEEVSDMSWGQFKPVLADAIVHHLQPIQERYYTVRNDEEKLYQILKDGAAAANSVAKQTLFETKVAMGFVTPK
jgi:tryptophanyl-tRNA synthetase